MAHAPATVANPVTEEAFTADRQQFFGGFCRGTVISTITVLVIVAFLFAFVF